MMEHVRLDLMEPALPPIVARSAPPPMFIGTLCRLKILPVTKANLARRGFVNRDADRELSRVLLFSHREIVDAYRHSGDSSRQESSTNSHLVTDIVCEIELERTRRKLTAKSPSMLETNTHSARHARGRRCTCSPEFGPLDCPALFPSATSALVNPWACSYLDGTPVKSPSTPNCSTLTEPER